MNFPRLAAIAAVLTVLAATTPPADADTTSCYPHVRSAAQRRLVQRESRGNPHAKNPHSTAFGCGQLLARTRTHFGRRLGIHPNTRDPAKQMRMMSAYIDTRWRTDHAALAHSLTHGWY